MQNTPLPPPYQLKIGWWNVSGEVVGAVVDGWLVVGGSKLKITFLHNPLLGSPLHARGVRPHACTRPHAEAARGNKKH